LLQILEVRAAVFTSHIYARLAQSPLRALLIVWVILGAFLTRSQSLVRCLEIASLVWGILIEFLPWSCTPLEICLQVKAGVPPYEVGSCCMPGQAGLSRHLAYCSDGGGSGRVRIEIRHRGLALTVTCFHFANETRSQAPVGLESAVGRGWPRGWSRKCSPELTLKSVMDGCGGHRTTLCHGLLVPELHAVLGTIPLPLLRSSPLGRQRVPSRTDVA
jgi:hypothetical protein